VSNSKAYLVGEQGPELFVPNTAGSIVPNNQMGGAGGYAQVTYNINAVDASSFRSLVAQDPEFMFAVTEQGRKRMPNSRR
jgi:phage-related minor tail protein